MKAEILGSRQQNREGTQVRESRILAATEIDSAHPAKGSRNEFPRLTDPLSGKEISYVRDPSFPTSAESLSVAELPCKPARVEDGPPTRNEQRWYRWSAPLLNREEELLYFRKLHSTWFLAAKIQQELGTCRAHVGLLARRRELLVQAKATRDFLVESNLRLVVSIARRAARESALTADELISFGNAALLNAVDRFDYSRGFRFSTYAYQAIQRSISRANQQEQRSWGRVATNCSESSEGLIKDAAESIRAESSALEAGVEVEPLLDSLAPRDRIIVKARFGIGSHSKPASFQTIANGLGLSKQRVATLFAEAIKELRQAIQRRHLKAY
jgi:RNA polymerase primary sigma factor